MTGESVAKLRELMDQHGVDAYIVPSTDPHQSEYVPALWQRRPFISGFNGSFGDVVVTGRMAGLWTDSRYFLQAASQLDEKVYTLFKWGLPEVPSYKDWLAASLGAGEKVGVDPRLLSFKEFGELREKLALHDVALVPIGQNLVDKVWTDRPAPPADRVLPHSIDFAGETHDEKLARLRQKMADAGADAHVVTTLDSIAWLFNIRGTDVDFNPVVIAYAIVTASEATLYIDEAKVADEVRAHLGGSVSLRPYDAFEEGLNQLGRSESKVWIDPATCSQWVVECLESGATLYSVASPVPLFKAAKNAAEVKGLKDCHVRDGVAMVRFLKWLDGTVDSGTVTEVGISKKLAEIRGMDERFRGPSFDTIASYKDHGAIIHYGPTPETDVTIDRDGILLVDSGGQYLDGTTDITRTLALSTPTSEQKERFTQILKGLILITVQPFPQGTAGRQIDALARLALWSAGVNFIHGVGHGIGAYLNVHEGPQAISYYRCTGVALEPGMVCSIEPGFYKDDEYGMRIENVAVVADAPDVGAEGAPFRRFETFTLCPIDLNLIERDLLTADEITWLNDYHKTVREVLGEHLDQAEREWLESATAPI